MAWTTPGTATAGEVLTAAFWNTQVRDNMVELAPFSAAWTSWTPTWSNLTVGNGVLVSKYIKVGKYVSFYIDLNFGTTTSVSGDINFSLPVNNANTSVGTGYLDVGAAYSAFPIILSNLYYVRCWNAS